MRLAEAKKLVEYFAIGGKGELLVTNSTTRLLNLIGQSVKALELGVSRAHIVAPVSGALLQELYTLDGAGTLISRDLYDGIRLAMPEDTPGILEMIRPLEAQGVLVQRDEQEVLRDVYRGFYYVYTRDSALLATAMLKRYSPTSAELGCLVVDPAYRKQGRGDAMLSFIERTAIAAGVTEIFALSTRTMQWFAERGFKNVPLEELPERRQKLYQPERNSKVYLKGLEQGGRGVDAEELFWAQDAGESYN
jgi:amino-acid N-acetyltransferase